MVSIKHFTQLEKLRGWRQLAFITGLAERSLPTLELGLDVLGLDIPIHPERIISALWQEVETPKSLDISKPYGYVEKLLEPLKSVEEYGARPTEDAVQLLLIAMEAVQESHLKIARQAAELSFNTVTQFVEFNEGDGLDDDELVALLDRHPLVKAEIQFQKELAKKLTVQKPSSEWIDSVRELASQGGVSSIGICLSDDINE